MGGVSTRPSAIEHELRGLVGRQVARGVLLLVGDEDRARDRAHALARAVAVAVDGGRRLRGEILKSRARVDRLRETFDVVAQTKLADGLRATLA